MLASELKHHLNNITFDDIIPLGEDIDGRKMYAIRIKGLGCSLILGDINIDDFVEWKNES